MTGKFVGSDVVVALGLPENRSIRKNPTFQGDGSIWRNKSSGGDSPTDKNNQDTETSHTTIWPPHCKLPTTTVGAAVPFKKWHRTNGESVVSILY